MFEGPSFSPLSVSVESQAHGFTLHRGELADKHLAEGRIHQVAIGLGDGGRRLGEGHCWLQLETGGRRGEELGGSRHVVDQSTILLLGQTLPNTVSLRKNMTIVTLSHRELTVYNRVSPLCLVLLSAAVRSA